MLRRPFYSHLLWKCFFRWLPGLFLFLLGGPVLGQALDVETNVVAGTCGNTNDTLTITVSGGSGTYQVTVTGPSPSSFNLALVPPATSVSKTLTGLALGNYTVSVTDGSSTFVRLPSVTSVLGPSQVFFSEAMEATCLNNDGVVDATVVGGTPPYTFLYNGATVGRTTGTTGVATGLPAGYLYLTVRDTNGCVRQGTVTVLPSYNLSLVMDNNTTICQGTSKQITINSNAASYLWSPATGLSSDTAKNPVASPTTTTTYTLEATLGVCTETGSLSIEVLPAPVASAVSPDTTCYGKSIQLQGGGGSQYMWTPATGLSNPTIADPVVIAPKNSITYSLTVTDANGCKSLSPAVVRLFVRPPYRVFAGDDTSVMVGQSVALDAVDVDGVGLNKFVWTPGVGLSNPLVADPVASFSEVGVYHYVVLATAPDGCSGTDSITIKAYAFADIFVPSAFTPNGDGHNDVLRAIPVSIRSFKYLSIFNRWGQQVFTTTNVGVGWDGSFNGTPAPPGTYVWIVGGIDYSGRVVEKRGTVILIR